MPKKVFSLSNIFSILVFLIIIITFVLLLKIVSYAVDTSLGRAGEAGSPIFNSENVIT